MLILNLGGVFRRNWFVFMSWVYLGELESRGGKVLNIYKVIEFISIKCIL